MTRAHRLAPVSLALLLAVLATSASAQYFGRNQVQWERFDFHVLETAHFDVYHYPAGNPVAEDAARMAERWYGRLSQALDHTFDKRKPIILYNDHADFQQTAIAGGELISEGTGGFTEPMRDRVVLPITSNYADTDHVIGHELVHVFQFDLAQRMQPVGAGREGATRSIGLDRLPLWMVEGLAEYLSQGRNDTLTSSWMRDAVLRDDLPTLEKMSRDLRYNPYQYGQAVWAYIGGRWGDAKVAELFRAALRVGPEESFELVLGLKWKAFAEEWHRDVEAYYTPILAARQKPKELGSELVGRKEGGRLAISPVLSPDGRWLAFLSTRDLFSVDLYLADAKSGKILRKLASADRDPHVDELRFIDSAGAWSPDGRRFAFPAVARGDNSLLVVDVDSGRVEQRIDPQVGEVTSLAWSPDGRRLVYAGLEQGVDDLYLYELDGGRVTKLTDDRYADLQPAWSADGSSLLFVSDRGAGADLAALQYAALGLFVLDVASKQVQALPGLAGANHIDPHYSTDGRWIYFLADPDGVSDVYRMPATGGAAERLTHIATGVAGITDKSPALTVADDRLIFSVFDERALSLRTLPLTTPPLPAPAGGDRQAAVLPPAETRRQATLGDLLAHGGVPAPPPQFELTGYRPKLGLTYLGPVGVGLYTDRYGTGVGGSVTALWSDVLERHQLIMALEGGSSTSGISGVLGLQALYLDRSGRFVWGVGGAHLPFTSAFTSVSEGTVDVGGQPVPAVIVEQVRQTQTQDQAQGLAQYPLSQTRRFETTVAYSRYSFDNELERVVLVDGRVVDDDIGNLPSPPSLNLVEGGFAYVGDNASFGFVSPVRGGRMRLEVGQTSGTLNFTSALADVRRYFFLRPLTLAVRGLHYGRYGGDSESPRLSPLYVGDETLVRGYALGSIGLSECTQVAGNPEACPEFDRLVGSRIAVANVELRIPLFGVEEFGLIKLRSLPTELAFFADAGAAWSEAETPRWAFDRTATDRVPVVSAGVAARILLLGALPLQFYYARPFHRQRENAVWGFLITPGW